ncbi:hypothetical protein E2562_025353 [Oryza meyeriana var. granulata]|uniref:Alpha/beta hydrolase fold-3 domain-containing protein n=1 Tax=Oryza meyeriana var. granulata TaxID=110450 RepID=A0A6G1DMT7_9ORYZ|nr:hypothetical protein E2562_025353 [Oryza meyeriana var. granulata]
MAGAAGNDDPRIDPPAEAIASLPCRRVLVTVATEDILRDRGRQYAARLRDGAWGGEATLVESSGEDHCFHLSPKFNPNTVVLMDHVVEFVAKGKTSAPTSMSMKQRHHRCTETEKTTSSVVASWGVSGGPRCMAQTAPIVQCSGQEVDNVRPSSKARKYPLPAVGLERSVLKSCL